MPDFSSFQNTLTQLYQLSSAILACGEDDIDKMRTMVDEREPLINSLMAVDVTAFSGDERQWISDTVAAVKTLDTAIEQHFNLILQAKGREMKEAETKKQALNQYKFPSVGSYSGIDNQG